MKTDQNLPFGKKAGDFRWLTSFEDAFVPQARHLNEKPLDEYELTQHYHFWKEDIDRARDLKIQMIRYGIPWYKVNPSPGKFDWDWVDKVLHYIADNCGLEIMIDLNHYSAPLWIENEFINHSFPQRLAEYAAEFAGRYEFPLYYQELTHQWQYPYFHR